MYDSMTRMREELNRHDDILYKHDRLISESFDRNEAHLDYCMRNDDSGKIRTQNPIDADTEELKDTTGEEFDAKIPTMAGVAVMGYENKGFKELKKHQEKESKTKLEKERYKKQKTSQGTADNSDQFLSGPKTVKVVLTRAHPDSTVDGLKNYIKTKGKEQNIEDIKVEDLSSPEWETKRFVVTLSAQAQDVVMNTDFWPKGIQFGKWWYCFLYNKVFAGRVKQIEINSSRACAIVVQLTRTYTVLIVSVYMPCDNYSGHNVLPEYDGVLDAIEQTLSSNTGSSCNDFVICGDFNTSFERFNAHSRRLSDFLDFNNLKLCWRSNSAQLGTDWSQGGAFAYNNSSCSDEQHHGGVTKLCDYIIQSCLSSSEKTIPTVKHAKDNQFDMRKRSLASKIEDGADFWTELQKINPKRRLVPHNIDGAEGAKEIASLFASKYDELYSSTPTSTAEITRLKEAIEANIARDEQYSLTRFSEVDVRKNV
ncbi:hypothetical protein CAPTEDRAFT_193430 [Capitella teleta]|uniref:Endonuclease/exonuclease/phosphatase domain-containing protein n=1 Tax=Capitella teleta TaxID=283909 RepID=R7U2R9_CAPTE|nr:hypothetical protein CAPTEDRAFT_193430 [Capitella teleta]|eukprot:ELT97470.1 hypothetical protein CAPTEDRAFT_193430 [Capitella teleta]